MIKQKASGRIGVLDSGVGGLTVVRSLEKILPGEDVVYFGDSANCPYGNRTKDDILRLMNNILDFMEKEEVKCIAVACNTLSTLYDEYAPARKTKIFSIVQAAADYVVSQKIKEVGLVSTEFTANSGWYPRLIHEQDPDVTLYVAGNYNLASLLDSGHFEAVPDNVHGNMSRLFAQGHPHYVILGCTHYPIVRDAFEAEAPDVQFIDPAFEMARAIGRWLKENDLLQEKDTHKLEVYTSGDPAFYDSMLKRLGIQAPDVLAQKILPEE